MPWAPPRAHPDKSDRGEHFATATTMYRKRGMANWPVKLERELKLGSGIDAEHRGEVPWGAM